MIDETVIRSRFEALRPRLDERGRRLFCAAEARSAGYGGVSVVARATGIARSTINRGLKDLQARDLAPSRVRRSGGGRPALLRSDPTLLEDLRLAHPSGTRSNTDCSVTSRKTGAVGPSRAGRPSSS